MPEIRHIKYVSFGDLLQKVNIWDQLLMKKLQNLTTIIRSWKDLCCSAKD